MKILLDTHYLLWAFIETKKISPRILGELLSPENEVYYSQISLWEISIKYNKGNLEIGGMNPEEFYEEVGNSYMISHQLRSEDLISFYRLPIEHKDPFDRMLVWQSIQSGYYFLSVDGKNENYEKHGLKLFRQDPTRK